MPRSIQERQLREMADQFNRLFKIPGLAETSFITTARFEGFAIESIHKVAAKTWPQGYSANRNRGKWCFQS